MAYQNNARYNDIRTVTVVGAVVNLLLGVGKVVVGVIGQSHALIADGVHSFSDLATDVLVVVAAKHSARDADEDHPYGHGRIETAATVGLGMLLLAVAAGITWDAGRRLVTPDLLLHPGLLALAAAAVSILGKEGLYQYTLVVAKRVRSKLLAANAWHHRSDAISSVVVLVGVAGTMAGFPYLDAVGSIAVALMIAKIAWDLAWQALRELVDTALEAEKVEEIRHTILSVDGVEAMHLLKTRRMGSDALVDVHIMLNDPRMSVSEGHQISETVRAKLIKEIDDVSEVMVHIDPEDDEAASPNKGLPLRAQALERLQVLWQPIGESKHIRRVVLHYLDGRLHVEVFLPRFLLTTPAQGDKLTAAFSGAAKADKDVGEVRVYFDG